MVGGFGEVSDEELEVALALAEAIAKAKGLSRPARRVLEALMRHEDMDEARRASGVPEGTFRRRRSQILRVFEVRTVVDLRWGLLVRAIREKAIPGDPNRT